MGIPETTQALSRLLVALHRLMISFYCLREYLHNSLNMERWTWFLLSSFTLLTSVTGTGRSSAIYQRRKVSITLATNHSSYNIDQHERCASVALSCGTNQSISSWIWVPFHEMEPIFDTAQVAKNLRLNRSETQGKPNTLLLVLEEDSNKMTPNNL